MTRVEQKGNKEKLILKELIDKMFEIAGHPLKFEDVEGRTDNWFQQHTMTEAQNEEWRSWGTKFLSKKRRFGIKLADREMRMIDLYCGLKISDSRFNNQEEKQSEILLSDTDSKVFFNELENPTSPNKALLKAYHDEKLNKLWNNKQ
jgi:hypothetical protein